jgi:hypothetical protein
MLAERLSKAWDERKRSTPIDPIMKFTAEGLILGAGTVLVRSSSGRDIPIDRFEPRVRALLAAAHLQPPSAESLGHLRKAAERWREGDDDLAAIHLALSRIGRLAEPEVDAHRLFLADGLLKDGIEPDAIVAAIEAGGPAFERLQKYDPDQPRVPAGSGRTSGQWTSDEGSGGSDQQAEVNPRTITEVSQGYSSIYACRNAFLDCIDTAVELARRYDSANDNRNETADISKCRDARWACDAMSWIIEDIPFIDYGGVIFPHRGVVIIRKGRLDVYYPPLPGGKTPTFSRRP